MKSTNIISYIGLTLFTANDLSQAIKEILPRMIEDAKTWHQESLRQLECLPDKLPFRCLRGELTAIYVIGEKDYDDIMPVIRL